MMSLSNYGLRTLFRLVFAVCMVLAYGSGNSMASDCDVREAQSSLLNLGFDPGPIDGIWGRSTRRALIDFQRTGELTESGQLDHETCAALSNSDLIRAAGVGNAREILDALQSGVSISVSNVFGENLLTAAAKHGHIGLVDELITLGFGINFPGSTGSTALIGSSASGHHRIVSLLLDNGASTAILNDRRISALGGASEKGHLQVVRTLLEFGVHPDPSFQEAYSPLYLASANNHLEVVKALLKAGASPNLPEPSYLRTPLRAAAQLGVTEVAAVLLEAGATPDLRDRGRATPLMVAAHGGHNQTVSLLLNKGSNIFLAMPNGRTAFHFAHTREIKNELERWASPHKPEGQKYLRLLKAASRTQICRLEEIVAQIGYGVDKIDGAPDLLLGISISKILGKNKELIGQSVNLERVVSAIEETPHGIGVEAAKSNAAIFARPETGSILEGESGGRARLSIEGHGRDRYVKLLSITSRETVVGFFLRKGETAIVQVLPGKYELRWASGTGWLGRECSFGQSTQYSKASDIFEFSAGATWSVSLRPRYGGNLGELRIDPEDW